MKSEYDSNGRRFERSREVLPVNIRQALELAASIIRRMDGCRLDKTESNGLIGNVQMNRGERRK